MTRLRLMLISLCLLPLFLHAETRPGIHELESDALAKWLLRDADEATRQSIARAMTGTNDPEAQAVEQARTQLDQMLTQYHEDDRFMLGQVVSWQEWDQASSEFILKPAFSENNLLLRNPFFPSIKSGDLPGYLLLILPNYTLTHRLPMEPHAASTYLDSRRDQSDFNRKRLYLEIHLKPVAFQQGQNVQMVIEKIDVFDHRKTRNLVATIHEKRKPSAVLADSLLSEGITSRAIPIHNFTIHGIRMLEVLGEHNAALGTCVQRKAEGEQDAHRRVRCLSRQSTHGITYEQQLDYIGGRLSGISMSTDTAPDQETLAKWHHVVTREFGLPAQSTERASWNKYGIIISYDPERLINGDPSAPFLEARATQSHDGN